MPRQSRAFEIPADVRAAAEPSRTKSKPATPGARRSAQKQKPPRKVTVAGVTLNLEAHEPADLLAALLAGREAAQAEARSWEASGERARAEVARERAERMERIWTKCAQQFQTFFTT